MSRKCLEFKPQGFLLANSVDNPKNSIWDISQNVV